MEDLLSSSLMKAEQNQAHNKWIVVTEHEGYTRREGAEMWVTGWGERGANFDRLTSYCLTSLQG